MAGSPLSGKCYNQSQMTSKPKHWRSPVSVFQNFLYLKTDLKTMIGAILSGPMINWPMDSDLLNPRDIPSKYTNCTPLRISQECFLHDWFGFDKLNRCKSFCTSYSYLEWRKLCRIVLLLGEARRECCGSSSSNGIYTPPVSLAFLNLVNYWCGPGPYLCYS